jgi:hypothetical protein
VDLKLPKFNNSSKWYAGEHGVPQGSVLGPLLFSLYINDFPALINKNADVLMFADDTNVLVTADTKDLLNEKLNFTLIHILNWFQANRLVVHPAKTKVLNFY